MTAATATAPIEAREQTVSTSSVAVAERVGYWADFVCAHLVQARCEATAPDGRFHGTVRQRRLAGVSVSQIHASAQRVTRTTEFLARAQEEHFIVTIQREGRGRMRQDGREVILAPGELALCATSRTYELGFDEDFWQTVMIVPADTLRRLVPSVDAVTATRLSCDIAAGRTLATLAESVAALPVATPTDAVDAAVHALLTALAAHALSGRLGDPAPAFVGREAGALAVAMQQALDTLDDGVFVVKHDLQLVFSNGRGQALLAQAMPMRLMNGRLEASGTRRPAFQAALDRVLLTGVAESIALGSASAATVEHVATLSRLRGAAPPVRGAGANCLLVVITSPGRQRTASAQQMLQVYGLTPAEARLAHALVCGTPLEAYVHLHGIKESTARTQLQSLMRKTGTSRQVDLVRLLMRLPSVGEHKPGLVLAGLAAGRSA